MKRTYTEKVRLVIVFALVCLFFTVATVRLVHLQIIMHPTYAQKVKEQVEGSIKIPAERGQVFDRHGRLVAYNVSRSSIYAWPVSEEEVREVARYLEKTYGLKRGTAVKKYNLRVRRFSYIDRHISEEFAAYIRETAPQGLQLRQEPERIYPYGRVGKQVLGFCDIDNTGRAGVEMSLEGVLAGTDGHADVRRDGLSNIYKVEEQALLEPQTGQSVVLTIDWCLQEIFEEELRAGVEEFNARSGMGAFIDCRTGEILAMAHYDPKEKHPDKPFKLRAISDQFEPGSTFKAFTAAAVMDAGLVDFGDSVFCEEGKWKIDRRILHDDKELGWLKFREIIELSSNIGIAKYAIELGGDEVYKAARKFGFGEKSNIGLPGETAGSVYRPQKWSDYTIASLSMGHAVAVNCLQMATAMGSVANGGELLQPQLVLCCIGQNQDVIDRCKRQKVRDVMKAETADSLAAFLRGVVERGTATKVNSPAVQIAGKTGTAQMLDPKTGRYSWRDYIGSFAGFFPADEPKIAAVVVLIAPKPVRYGGHTAGPVMRRVAERYMVLNPDLFDIEDRQLAEKHRAQENTMVAPLLTGMTAAEAKAEAEKLGVRLRTNAEDGTVVWQYPPADRIMFAGDDIVVAVESPVQPGLQMADLEGLSIRKASAYLQFAGIKSRIEGRGKVFRQSIKPGTPVTRETVCRLECRPI